MSSATRRLGTLDRVALVSLEEVLREARRTGDRRPPFVIVADCLADLGVVLPESQSRPVSIGQAREM